MSENSIQPVSGHFNISQSTDKFKATMSSKENATSTTQNNPDERNSNSETNVTKNIEGDVNIKMETQNFSATETEISLPTRVFDNMSENETSKENHDANKISSIGDESAKKLDNCEVDDKTQTMEHNVNEKNAQEAIDSNVIQPVESHIKIIKVEGTSQSCTKEPEAGISVENESNVMEVAESSGDIEQLPSISETENICEIVIRPSEHITETNNVQENINVQVKNNVHGNINVQANINVQESINVQGKINVQENINVQAKINVQENIDVQANNACVDKLPVAIENCQNTEEENTLKKDSLQTIDNNMDISESSNGKQHMPSQSDEQNQNIEQDKDQEDNLNSTDLKMEVQRTELLAPAKSNNNETQNTNKTSKNIAKNTKAPSTELNDKRIYLPILKLLGIHTELELSIREMKDMLKKIKASKPAIRFPDPFDTHIPSKVRNCTTIHTSNWPTWIEPQHIRIALKLLTDMDVDKEVYYVEILTYTDKSKRRGEFLIHFLKFNKCLHIFRQLRQVVYHNIFIKVELDIDDIVSNTVCRITPTDIRLPKERWSNPHLDPKYRFRISPTYMDTPVNYRPDPLPACFKISDATSDTREDADVLTLSMDDTNNQFGESNNAIVIQSDEDECTIIEVERETIDLDAEDTSKEDATTNNDKTKHNDTVEDKDATTHSDNNTSDALTKSQRRRLRKKEAYDTCTVVYISNLPVLKAVEYLSAIRDLLNHHTSFNADTKNFFIRRLQNCHNRPLNECFLKFESAEDAKEVAKGLNGVITKGHRLKVTLDIGNKMSGHPEQIEHSKAYKRKLEDADRQLEILKKPKFEEEWGIVNAETSVPKEPEIYGLNKRLLKKLGLLYKPLTNFVLVSNLHESVTISKLREVFSLAGEVVDASLDCKNGELRALIEYDHPVEAVQAISLLNGQKLYGKEMQIEIDNSSTKSLPEGLSGVNKGLGPNGETLKGVRANLEVKPLYDLLEKAGILRKSYKSQEAFFLDYFYDEKITQSNAKTSTPVIQNPTPYNKPTVETAIEALGAVLVALELIPPTTDCKDLIRIVEALKDSPKVRKSLDKYTRRCRNQENLRRMRERNSESHQSNEPTQQTPDPPVAKSKDQNVVDALERVLNSFMQNLNSGKTPSNNDNQQNTINEDQSVNNTLSNNLNPAMTQVAPNLNNNVNTGMLHPGMTYVNPGMANVNPGMANVNPGMANVNPGMANVNPGMANVNPGIPHVNQVMPNVNPGIPTVNPVANQMIHFGPGVPNMNPGNVMVNTGTSGPSMPNMNPRLSNIRPGTSIMMPRIPNVNAANIRPAPHPFMANPGMQNVNPVMPNVNPALLNTGPGFQNMHQPSSNVRHETSSTMQDIARLYEPGSTNTNRTPKQNAPPRIKETLPPRQRSRYFNRPIPKIDINLKTNIDKNRQIYESRIDLSDDKDDHEPYSDDSDEDHTDKMDMLQFTNLPPSVTKGALTKKMEEVGEVIFTEITGPGRALVRFKLPRDADKCQRLFHRSRVDGSVIDVKLV